MVVFGDNIFGKLILLRIKVKDNAVVNFEDFKTEWLQLSIESYCCPNKINGGQKTDDKMDLI